MFVITTNKPRPLACNMQECDCPEGTEDCWHNYQLGFYLEYRNCRYCWPTDCRCL